MQHTKVIDKLYNSTVDISKHSYTNFVTSFKLNKKAYGKVTLFETRVYALFYIDYCIAAKNVTADFREDYYTHTLLEIINEFSGSVQNDNLMELIDDRYNEYAQIAVRGGEKWIQSFHTLYEIKLKATENSNSIRKLSPIKFEGFLGTMSGKMQFIKGEINNSYRAAKLVDKILGS